MGKILPPSNATAARPSADTPVGASTSNTTLRPGPGETPTAESLGWQLRAALPPLRLHSVSLYDDQANVLWLSEGALGPDEHSLVIGAIERLQRDTSTGCQEQGLDDGRVAIFLAVRAPQGTLVGLCMILADIKSIGESILERLATPQVRTIMQKFAVLLRPLARSQTNPALKVLDLPPQPVTVAAVRQAPAPEPTTPDTSLLSPQGVSDILEFELAPDSSPGTPPQAPPVLAPALTTTPAPAASHPEPAPIAAVAPTVLTLEAAPVDTAVAARAPEAAATTASAVASSTALPRVRAASGTTTSTRALSTGATTTSRTLVLPEGLSLFLDAQPFTRLRAGGRTRRYEVTARVTHREVQRVPAGLDHFALQRLLAWLAANRASWSSEPASFTLNLSIATLEDERFPQFIASNLKSHGIAPDNIGFEIAEALCLQKRAQVERFITLCDRIGCFVVIDDFSLDSSVISLLRSNALRLVKIDPRLTSVALKDKLAQALVVATVQAVKVLGIHCSAKRVESQASLQWLTAIGCDFAQGSALGQPQPLESLFGVPAA